MMIPAFRRFGRGFGPWAEMERMQREMNRLFSDFSTPSSPEYPAVNVWTSEEQAVVTSEIPGVDPADVDISVVGKTLTLRGDRKPEETGEDDSYHRRERGYGAFTRTVELPYRVNAEKVTAAFSKGVLHITLPRAEEDKPRKITVKSV